MDRDTFGGASSEHAAARVHRRDLLVSIPGAFTANAISAAGTLCAITLVLQVEIILVALLAAALIASVVVGEPKSFQDPPRDVLICCAHSDDCVIMGATNQYVARRV